MSDSLTGCPTAHTIPAKKRASSKLKNGPATATMILSRAEILGNFARSACVSPSITSIGASCGSETNPPNGIVPSEYWTPFTVFFQIGLPNQMPNFSITKPRHRAARK